MSLCSAAPRENVLARPTTPQSVDKTYSLTALCVRLASIIRGRALTHADSRLATVREILQHYDFTADKEWRKFARYDPEYPYTRNLVDDGDGGYNLLLLCWGTQQGSPIHDHDNAHCLLRVLEGQLTEKTYRWPSGPHETVEMREIGQNVLRAGDVGYINDAIGLHAVRNNDPEVLAVSLHLYSPPMVSNLIFDQRTSTTTTVGPYSYFSSTLLRTATSDSGETVTTAASSPSSAIRQ